MDQLANGRQLRAFNVADDFSRECSLQIVDLPISGQSLVRELRRLAVTRLLPARIALNNAPKLPIQAMFF